MTEPNFLPVPYFVSTLAQFIFLNNNIYNKIGTKRKEILRKYFACESQQSISCVELFILFLIAVL